MLRSGGTLTCARLLLLALASSLTLLALPAAGSAATAVDRYGVTDSYLRAVNPATRRLALGVLQAGGVRVVRSDTGWGQVEPAAPGADGVHHYDWTAQDQWVGSLAQAGLRLYPIVDYAAPWASVSGTWNSRPRDPAQYAAFAAAVVARYGPTGTFWGEHPELPRMPVQSVELWNEENTAQFWVEQGSAPRDYAQLYLAARNAVRAVAPSTEVVVGGLVDRGAESFLRGMLAAVPALAGNIDSVGFHGYLLSPADLLGRVASVRRTMDGLGLGGATIGLTEVGWSQLEGSDEQRGANLAEISRLTTDPTLKVNRIISFAAMSNEGDPNQWDQWFGLLNHDGTPKSTFVRWAAQIAALQLAAAVQPVVAPTTSRAGTPVATAATTAAAKKAKAAKAKAAKARKAAASRKARAARARAARARAARARAARARAARVATTRAARVQAARQALTTTR